MVDSINGSGPLGGIGFANGANNAPNPFSDSLKKVKHIDNDHTGNGEDLARVDLGRTIVNNLASGQYDFSIPGSYAVFIEQVERVTGIDLKEGRNIEEINKELPAEALIKFITEDNQS